MDLRCSVIIPAYRAAETIGRAVDSVVMQSIPAHEILVVDDGSPDDIAGALRPYGDRVRVIRQRNAGAASARNMGIELATGGLLAFLDADDYWEPDKLQTHVALYCSNPQLGLTHSGYFEQLPGGKRQVAERVFPLEPAQVVRLSGAQAFEWSTMVWTGTVVVPRHIVGDERFVSGLEPAEDRDLWLRLLLAAPTCYLAEPLATAVLEPGSMSRSNVDQDCANMLKVIARHARLIGPVASLKWKSHTHYRWSACTQQTGPAARHLLQSALLWPLPYARRWVSMPFARPRLFARILRQAAAGLGGVWTVRPLDKAFGVRR